MKRATSRSPAAGGIVVAGGGDSGVAWSESRTAPGIGALGLRRLAADGGGLVTSSTTGVGRPLAGPRSPCSPRRRASRLCDAGGVGHAGYVTCSAMSVLLLGSEHGGGGGGGGGDGGGGRAGYSS